MTPPSEPPQSPRHPSPQNPPPHQDALPHDQRRARRPATTTRLTRSRFNRVLTGVLGGIAEYIGADPRTVRIVFSVAAFFSGGILVVAYLLLWGLLPRARA